jgi:hypothetical protein
MSRQCLRNAFRFFVPTCQASSPLSPTFKTSSSSLLPYIIDTSSCLEHRPCLSTAAHLCQMLRSWWGHCGAISTSSKLFAELQYNSTLSSLVSISHSNMSPRSTHNPRKEKENDRSRRRAKSPETQPQARPVLQSCNGNAPSNAESGNPPVPDADLEAMQQRIRELEGTCINILISSYTLV